MPRNWPSAYISRIPLSFQSGGSTAVKRSNLGRIYWTLSKLESIRKPWQRWNLESIVHSQNQRGAAKIILLSRRSVAPSAECLCTRQRAKIDALLPLRSIFVGYQYWSETSVLCHNCSQTDKKTRSDLASCSHHWLVLVAHSLTVIIKSHVASNSRDDSLSDKNFGRRPVNQNTPSGSVLGGWAWLTSVMFPVIGRLSKTAYIWRDVGDSPDVLWCRRQIGDFCRQVWTAG